MLPADIDNRYVYQLNSLINDAWAKKHISWKKVTLVCRDIAMILDWLHRIIRSLSRENEVFFHFVVFYEQTKPANIML